MKEIVLCACSGMNPRGEVARAAVYDVAQEDEECKICCIVATGGGKQKYVDLVQDKPIIVVNGCPQNCTTTLLKEKGANVDKVLLVPEILEKEGLTAECTVRMNENDEKCVDILKEEIRKAKENL
ncbi:MAG: hypothetical protein BZ138_00120 [Methanosphaera sp. rholeuAM270]|nr:MAG: hypothetical protein BZ138_00120 [Methanosphaera sp. rholeuAM270]